MKVLFICGREPEYSRNALLLKALKNRYEVIECTSQAAKYSFRFLHIITKFLFQYHNADLIFVGFLGQPLVILIRLLTKKPIIFDAFISLFDTVCFDRKKASPNSLVGKFCFWLDQTSCQKADKVIVDTKTHRDYFIEMFRIPPGKVEYIYVGAEESVFSSQKFVERKNDKTTIFYYGTGLPLQGVDIILKAAKRIESEKNIVFRIAGPINNRCSALIRELNLCNVRFLGFVPYRKLSEEIGRADICLGGHFSNIDKAKRVIAGKTFQFIAMKKPVIIGDNEANKELFIDGESCKMVNMADPDDLAKAIIDLKSDNQLRDKIANRAYQVFQEKCSLDIITQQIFDILGKYEKSS
ncbi:MAG: glycosyltransferase family 4 protein [Patescibacteria group bacterium]